jgi:hypothetical protein
MSYDLPHDVEITSRMTAAWCRKSSSLMTNRPYEAKLVDLHPRLNLLSTVFLLFHSLISDVCTQLV